MFDTWPDWALIAAGSLAGALLAVLVFGAWLKFEEWDELRQLRRYSDEADT